MQTLKFNLKDRKGCFKILNATNGGPWHRRHAKTQWRSNFEYYKNAKFPYSRNHDSGVEGIYGGPYSHDISAIFPNFDADVDNPNSYDFACTDESILCTLEAGTKTFFRLGQTIEHQIKKHNTLPPKDFKKWAQICEHIIKHYNEGWANGFNLNIEYWEIWNEPDLDAEDSTNKRTWGGTKAQFFDLYETVAKHLKKCFPNLKIGGPASAGNLEWCTEFISEMKNRSTPIDFFSWHAYCCVPNQMLCMARIIKQALLDNGYDKTESILNEWNYIKGWREEFLYSIKSIIGIKGASFAMACLCEAQKSDGIDMMMYYDTRPSPFCGVFDYYTYEPLKTYYPLSWYGMFYDMEAEIRCENNVENIYTLCGVDKNDKVLLALTFYSDDDALETKEIKIDLGKKSKFEIFLLDELNDGVSIGIKEELTLSINKNTCLLIKEI